VSTNDVINRGYREPPHPLGVSHDPPEGQVIANNANRTIVIAAIIAVVPVDIVEEVHAAGAAARSSGVLRCCVVRGCCDLLVSQFRPVCSYWDGFPN
jgi:hypothetical protein